MNRFDELAETQRLARIGSWYWDTRTGEHAVSRELCRMFGREFVPPFAVQGGTMYAAETWAPLGAAVQEIARTGIAYDLEFPARREDASHVWVNARGEALRNADGEVVGLRGTVQDITERKQTEMALRESKQRLEFTMQLGQMGGWDLDLQSHVATHTLEHDRIFGYETPLPLWNYDLFMEHVLPEDRFEVDRLFGQAIAAHANWNFECRIRRADGEVRWIRAAGGHHRDNKDTAWRLSGIVQDITERNRMDLALQERNAELESARAAADKANLAKSDFLSSMSHELRTPLNAIIGFAQLVESGSPAPTPSQKRSLDQILKGGWYLLELINEILDLAMIESGKTMLSLEPVSLVEVMLECRAMIELQAQSRGIRLTFPRFELPYFVSADRTRVKQVLINLLFNAIKYNKPGGAVTVEYTLSAPDSIRISVRDTGVGLTAEQLAQLFQPFNRLGKEAGAEEGTGIGLVVTKRLVEMMGGSIGVDSTFGVGSVFWIEFERTSAPPAIEDVEEEALVDPPVPDGRPQRTLLYVEDNPANLELVEQLVARRSDLRLLNAADGNLGIELARAHQPAMILMDINLPGISGLEAMKILRADPTTAHIPIVALSANALPRDIEQGLAAGFFDYVTKPIKVNEFMDTLDVVLEFSKKTG